MTPDRPVSGYCLSVLIVQLLAENNSNIGSGRHWNHTAPDSLEFHSTYLPPYITLSHFLYRLSYEARLSCNGVESEGPVLLMAGTEGLHDSVTEGGLALFRYVGHLTKWYSVPLLRSACPVQSRVETPSWSFVGCAADGLYDRRGEGSTTSGPSTSSARLFMGVRTLVLLMASP